MGLKDDITPEIIANTVSMDSVSGYYVLVEGDSDDLFYAKFLNPNYCSIEICHGKENLLDAVEILNTRSIKNKYIGIVDSDYDTLLNITYSNNIINTDLHSVETMCLCSDSFEDVVREYLDKEKLDLKLFTDINKLREYIISLTIPIAKLRIVNIQYSYDLRFKPPRGSKKDLDYKKFICKDSFTYLGDDKLIDAITKYHNQGVSLDLQDLKSKLNNLDLSSFNHESLAHGHDIAIILAIAIKKPLGKSKLSSTTPDDIERALRLAYSKADFDKTSLRQAIHNIDPGLLK